MLTVRSQLNRLILVVISAVVLLMSGAFFVFEYVTYRKETVERVYPMAATIGIHLSASLVVPNQPQALEILATTADAQEIVAVYLFDRNDQPFAYYKRPHTFTPAGRDTPDNTLSRDEIGKFLASGDRGFQTSGNYMAVFVPIRQAQKKLGTLYLIVSLTPLYERILWWLVVAAGIIAMAAAVGTYLASRLQRNIVEPISSLSGHMARISAGERPDSVAIPAVGELGALVSGFNTMLEQIKTNERFLAEINLNLEEHVHRRTAELGRSENRYRSLFESSPISLWEEDFSAVTAYLRELGSSGVSDFASYFHEHPEAVAICAGLVRVVDINTRTLALYRASDPATLLDGLDRILTTRSFDTFTLGLVAVAMGETSYSFETTNCTLEGEVLDVALHFAVVPGHEHDYSRVVISIEDITPRKTLERELRASLKEKDLLLQEVHHRVKNNLQIISSLIGLQIKNLGAGQIASELHSTLLRVRSMALIHERLYRTLPGNIALEDFIGELSREIIGLYGEDTKRITLELDVEPIPLTVDQGMTFAIIINELLTNALKYAFPAGRRGQVGVNLHQLTNDIVLNVQDNGIGLPADFDPKLQKSLGYRLLLNLAEQVRGTLNVAGSENGGTCVTLRIQNHRTPGTTN